MHPITRKNVGFIAIVAAAVVLSLVVLAREAGAAGFLSPATLWKKSGDAILPLLTTTDIGTSGTRIDKVWATSLDVSGTATIGTLSVTGTAAGNFDLDGYNLIMNQDADDAILGDRDATILDDQIGIQLNNALEAIWTTTELKPGANDGSGLGVSGTAFADLFLASGAVIDFFVGDVTLTHATNTLAFGGGSFVVGNGTNTLTTDRAIPALEVLGTGGAGSTSVIGRWTANAFAGELQFVKSRNATIGSSTIVADNDFIGVITFIADDGTDFANISGQFYAEVDDASPAANDVGLAYVWTSMAGGAGGAARETLRLSAAGDLLVADGGGVVIGHTAQVATSVTPEFQILGTGGPDSSMVIGRWSANASDPSINFIKSRAATIGGAAAIVLDNDLIGATYWYPDDGTDNANVSAAFFAEVDDLTPAANDVGTAFVWQSQAGGGASLTESMRLDAAKTLTLSKSVAGGAALDINWTFAGYTNSVGAIDIVRSGNFTGVATESAADLRIVPTHTITEPGSGVFNYHGGHIDVSGLTITGGAGEALVAALYLKGHSSTNTALDADGDIYIEDTYGLVVGHYLQITTDTTPEFQVLGLVQADSAALIGTWGANAFGAELQFAKSRAATIGGTATIVADNDNIGGIFWYPDDGTDFANNSAAFFVEVDDGSVAANDIKTAFVWQTQSGAGTLAERMRIAGDGMLDLAGNYVLRGYGTVGGGNTTPDADFTFYVGRDFTGTAANALATMYLQGNITEASSGTHATIAQLHMTPMTVTNGGGSEVVTNLATLYIEGAPTAGSTPTNGPYSIFVDAGVSRFDDGVTFGLVAANTYSVLNQYVEGTFTPTVTLVGGAGNTVPVYTTNTGRYTRIGNRVFVDVYLTGDGGAEGAGTGAFSVALPIAAGASNPTSYFPVGIFANGTAEDPIWGQIAGSGTVVDFTYEDVLNNFTVMTGAEQNNATRTIRLKFQYEV